MNIPDFGIEISFIDNRAPGQQTTVTKLGDGFMTNSIAVMVLHLRETADKLEKLA